MKLVYMCLVLLRLCAKRPRRSRSKFQTAQDTMAQGVQSENFGRTFVADGAG